MEQNVEEAYLSGNVMMMGVARLRLLRNSTPRHPSPSLRSLFCRQKKSTNGKTGLPSVALAKDGGRLGTRTPDIHGVNVTL